MAFLSWRKEYRVGVEVIDDEHRYLFDLINAFHDNHVGGANHAALGKILNLLVHYAEQHFQHEEAIMADAGYPAHAAHCALHEELYLTLFRLAEQLGAGSLRVDTETMRFVHNWLAGHIVRHDLQFADFLARRPKLEQ
jgi:hemerythrin